MRPHDYPKNPKMKIKNENFFSWNKYRTLDCIYTHTNTPTNLPTTIQFRKLNIPQTIYFATRLENTSLFQTSIWEHHLSLTLFLYLAKMAKRIPHHRDQYTCDSFMLCNLECCKTQAMQHVILIILRF
jgi:hypothetical protein